MELMDGTLLVLKAGAMLELKEGAEKSSLTAGAENPVADPGELLRVSRLKSSVTGTET